MIDVWTGLDAGQDVRLLLIGGLVGFVGLLMTLRLFARAMNAEADREAWVALSAVAAAASVWAGHFVAMTAYHPELHSGYDPVRTSFAFMTALAGMTAGLWAAASEPKSWRPALSGGLFGIGATAAFAAGVGAYATQGVLVWNPIFLLMATPACVVLAATGFFIGGDLRSWERQSLAALLLFAGVAVVHVAAMAGLSVAPEPAAALPSRLISPDLLAVMVTLVAGLAIAAGFAVTDTTDATSRSMDRTRLREIIDAMPEAMAYCDAQDRLTFWNKRYADLCRQSSMPVAAGTPFRDVLKAALTNGGVPSAIGDEAGYLAERMALHTSDQAIHEHQLNDGRWLRIEERKTADGGVIMVCVDITDLKRKAEVLSEARDAAQSANRSKSEFLANMSHEIRTPLNGVIGLTDALARSELSDGQREIVEIIRASGQSLERLLNDVLDLARVESGRLEIRHEAFKLGDVIRQVAGLASLRARDKGVRFRLVADPSVDSMVAGDPDRIKQVLLNLLSNAVKFTEDGEVALKIWPLTTRSEQTFRFEVSDTGVGFDQEHKARLFQRFEQADGSITRRFGGSGLGLAIVSELTTLLGGTFDAHGIKGSGATFIVELPLPAASAELAPTGASASASASAAPPTAKRSIRVLIAEDHPTNRKVVELLLQGADAELTTVENGAQAVDAFAHERFDIVLMDMQMPVMDGLAAIGAIRRIEADRGGARTPIIAVTGNALPEHVRASEAAGADAHLAKPITGATLLPAIEKALTRAEAASAANNAVAAHDQVVTA
jgi:signal transduction histidine kinase/NO-binding membrane sensor protein with MHYT domain/FixJ family two-component response regulator